MTRHSADGPTPDDPYHQSGETPPVEGTGPQYVPDDGSSAGATSAPATPSSAPGQPVYGHVRSRRLLRAKGTKAPWWELPVLVAVAIVVAIVVKSFLIQPFYIPSESMEQTLHGCSGCSGDRILVNKPIYDLRDPHPGDIIVFRAPEGWDTETSTTPPSNPIAKGLRWFGQLVGVVPPDEKDLVKRVIAIGGQTIQCCDAQGNVQISDNGPNGPWRSLHEPYVYQPFPVVAGSKPGAPIAGDNATFGPITIPAGRLWVMGDHRSDSADSAFHCRSAAPATHICSADVSTVAVSAVIGKAVVIAWPPSRWRTLGTPSTFESAVAWAGTSPALLTSLALILPIGWIRRRRR